MMWPLATKPEVEIWWQPDILTQRPRLPIQPPIHYGAKIPNFSLFVAAPGPKFIELEFPKRFYFTPTEVP